MKFKLINPSEPYTMNADDLQVAAVAACLLAYGKYGLEGLGEDVGADLPVLARGGHDEWFTAAFGTTWAETAEHVIDQRRDALARAFDSVTLVRPERSSMNDIGGRAKALAAALRKGASP